jgi:hypothetical protein
MWTQVLDVVASLVTGALEAKGLADILGDEPRVSLDFNCEDREGVERPSTGLLGHFLQQNLSLGQNRLYSLLLKIGRIAVAL